LDEFLHEVENPQDLVLKIASHRQETSEWGLRAIGILFEFTDEPYKLLTHIDIEYAKEFIRSMYDDELNEFVESSENPRALMAFIKSL
jgi:hypothetical protein